MDVDGTLALYNHEIQMGHITFSLMMATATTNFMAVTCSWGLQRPLPSDLEVQVTPDSGVKCEPIPPL